MRYNPAQYGCTIIVIILLVTVLTSGLALCQDIGHDVLGLQSKSFSSSALKKFSKYTYPLGILDYTFDSSLAPIRHALDYGNVTILRVHLINGSCIRRRTCGKYYPFRLYGKDSFNAAVLRDSEHIRTYIRRRVKAYCQLLALYPNTKLLLSPVLEHNLSRFAWIKLATQVHQYCPTARLVNNPEFFFVANKFGAWDEYHGLSKIPKHAEIVSMDGFDAKSVDINAWLKTSNHVKLRFMWEAGYNCLLTSALSFKFIDPRDRTACSISKEIVWLWKKVKSSMATTAKKPVQ